MASVPGSGGGTEAISPPRSSRPRDGDPHRKDVLVGLRVDAAVGIDGPLEGDDPRLVWSLLGRVVELQVGRIHVDVANVGRELPHVVGFDPIEVGVGQKYRLLFVSRAGERLATLFFDFDVVQVDAVKVGISPWKRRRRPWIRNRIVWIGRRFRPGVKLEREPRNAERSSE